MMNKPGKNPTPARDALALLKADHEKVMRLFREFDDLKGIEDEDERKGELVDEICYELTVHTMIEDEIFYPVLRSAIDDDDMMDEAEVEHAGARELISQLEVMYPGDDHYDATVTVLGEEIAHHIEKEETDMFDAARSAGLDLDDLGAQLATRKEELDEDLPAPATAIDAVAPRSSVRRPSRPPN
ncbi:MAG: hemerythrin domain-containing protein [Telluria sp.]